MSREPGPGSPAGNAEESLREQAFDVVMTGVAIIVPFVVTPSSTWRSGSSSALSVRSSTC